jgi:exonuclease III
MKFGTWNVRSLYRADSLKTVARELGKYKLNLVGVQEVRWENGTLKLRRIIRFSNGATSQKILNFNIICVYLYHSIILNDYLAFHTCKKNFFCCNLSKIYL